MDLHPALAQQGGADEEMALEHGAVVSRESRACEGEAAPQRVHQRVGNRADIARWRAVKGGAVFLEELPATGLLEPMQGG